VPPSTPNEKNAVPLRETALFIKRCASTWHPPVFNGHIIWEKPALTRSPLILSVSQLSSALPFSAWPIFLSKYAKTFRKHRPQTFATDLLRILLLFIRWRRRRASSDLNLLFFDFFPCIERMFNKGVKAHRPCFVSRPTLARSLHL